MAVTRLLIVACICFAQARVLFSSVFMSVEDLRPGMKGYGLSVFRGWEPERFDVEILDVMRGVGPKKDVILARLSGAALGQAGVVAGMSGSPVYVDGKLVGAVAFAWPFAKEPLCGIQPIGQMLSEKKNTPGDGSRAAGPQQAPDERFRNISTPVMVSCFSGQAGDFVGRFFERDAPGGPFVVSAAGRAAGRADQAAFTGHALKSPDGRLKAGDAVSVNLVDGDMTVQAVGTVTYVSNRDVFIFGHPLDLSGHSRLPVSRAYIYSVIPSLQVSFKLGSSSETIGATVQDGPSGVYCRTGDVPAMVPVDMSVLSDTGSGLTRYRFRVTDHPGYFSGLAAAAVSSAIIDHAGFFDDKRIEMDLDMTMLSSGERRTVRKKFRYAFHPSYFSVYGMIGDLSRYLSVFAQNPFRDVAIQSVAVDVRVARQVRFATMEQFSVDRAAYFPGDVIRGRAVLREYRGGFRTENISIRVPEDAAPGSYWVLCGSEPSFYGDLSKSFPKYFSVNSLDDLVRLANMREDPSVLASGLYSSQPGAWAGDKMLEKLPDGYQSVFGRVTDKTGAVLFPDLRVQTQELDLSVFGSQKVPVTVQPRGYLTAE